MKILLFGKNGQVGHYLEEKLATYGQLLALDRNGGGGYSGDLEKLTDLESTIVKFKPDIVFNAAAYTAVDDAEIDESRAFTINAHAVGVMARACKKIGASLVHFSTDYVFDGSGNKPRNEEAFTSPINKYGETKLIGEKEVVNSGCRYLIFRTSWVYASFGKNFLRTILKLASNKRSLSVVSDQVGTPTPAKFIAEVAVEVAILSFTSKGRIEGIYNVVPKGFTTWFDFSKYIVDSATIMGFPLVLSSNAIKPVKSSEYKTRAMRPLNSRLDNSKILKLLPVDRVKTWDYYVRDCLMECLEKNDQILGVEK